MNIEDAPNYLLVDELESRGYMVTKSNDIHCASAIKYMVDNIGMIESIVEIVKYSGADDGLYSEDCIALFFDIIDRKGVDFVYALLEPHKII